MMSSYISLENVSLSIDKISILEDISFSVKKGECLGLTGANGCGKTMIMKCISGLVIPTTGTITVDGKTIGNNIDFPESMSVIIETPGFIPYLTGFQNLKNLALINKKINDTVIKDTILNVGLNPDDRRKVKKYSLGMRQRLALAQALMENPDLYILDEPFNGLDIKGTEEIRNILKALKEDGKTIIISSHNPYDLEFLCDRTIHIDAGKIL